MDKIVNEFFEEVKREFVEQTKDKAYVVVDLEVYLDLVSRFSRYGIKGTIVNENNDCLGLAFYVYPENFIGTIKEEARLAVQDIIRQTDLFFWELLYGF